MKGSLYLVATPIGNLKDITLRAIEVLQSVDIIACEDTRHTAKLLNHLNIKKKMISYFEHNKREKGEYLISLISEGTNIALVSDAGTPAISDPGEDLVKLAMEQGVTVVPIPGPCAFVSALIGSGLFTGRFIFEGFLPVNKRAKRERIEELKGEKRTIIFYEAPHKLKKNLKELLEALGDRNIVLARELTKIHEEFEKTTLKGAIEKFETNSPRGEYVLLLEGDSEKETIDGMDDSSIDMKSISEQVDDYINKGMDKKCAMKQVAKERNMGKREIYMHYVART